MTDLLLLSDEDIAQLTNFCDLVDRSRVNVERLAARDTDPQTSKEAVRRYHLKWDSMNMRALRVHYQAHLAYPGHGLTNYEAEVAARHLGGLGKSPWKRISELHTKFTPPLITNALDGHGNKITRKGEFNTPVEVFVITAFGIRLINEAKAEKGTP